MFRAARSLGGLGLAVWLGVMGLAAAAAPATPANVPVEIELSAARDHADPFNTLAVDVAFTDPRGTTRTVPAFWAGGQRWKVRYASPVEGAHRWRSACSDTADAGLHGAAGEVQVVPYRGDNPLFARGPVRVAAVGRHLEHADGTLFLWLGDTWWMGLCHRLRWPDEFRTLAADRKAKGFNVVQIVAGLYPDMPAFDPRGANEAGFPWEKEYARIRPEYFDAADQRLRHLVDQGITPCIVGAWGYFLPWMGEAKVKQHWRYLIARYGSWPVVWCAAGEANLPWYLAKGFPYDDREQVHGWTRVLKYIRDTDPFRRPVTIHPTAINRYTARHATDDAALLDFDMLQTPHGERDAAAVAVRAARESYAARPVLPVINGEAAYEMLSDRLPTRWTRAMFWLCVTNGTAGHTYGANGIWQCNRKGEPHGKSPHGGTYGVLPWDEAMKLPGSAQLGAAKRFLERYPWHQFEPHPDWVAWAGGPAAVPWGDWIWYPEGDPKRDAPVAARWFRRTFEVGGPVKKATLHMAADDAFQAFLNGREVGRGASWKQPAAFDVTAHLQDGKNVLAVRAENSAAPVKENPAGLLAALVIERADGGRRVIGSDGEWRAAQMAGPGWERPATKDEDWPKVVVTAKYGAAPWGRLGDEDPMLGPQATGRPDGVRIVYALEPRPVVLSGLTPGGAYRVIVFDPVSGETKEAGAVRADAAGRHTFAPPDHGHDWVLAVEPMTAASDSRSPEPPDVSGIKPEDLGIKLVTPAKDPKTGFVVGGKNPTELVARVPELNGKSIAALEKVMRPGQSSGAGFLGPDEGLLAVLAADNKLVVDEWGLTHQELARHLHVLGALAVKHADQKPYEVRYRGSTLRLRATCWRGYQESPFEDGTRTNCDATVENLATGEKLSYSLLVPHMIERYGFYEGTGTKYRVEPRQVVKVLDFLKPPAGR